jgi:hypothetical protein
MWHGMPASKGNELRVVLPQCGTLELCKPRVTWSRFYDNASLMSLIVAASTGLSGNVSNRQSAGDSPIQESLGQARKRSLDGKGELA